MLTTTTLAKLCQALKSCPKHSLYDMHMYNLLTASDSSVFEGQKLSQNETKQWKQSGCQLLHQWKGAWTCTLLSCNCREAWLRLSAREWSHHWHRLVGCRSDPRWCMLMGPGSRTCKQEIDYHAWCNNKLMSHGFLRMWLHVQEWGGQHGRGLHNTVRNETDCRSGVKNWARWCSNAE